MIPLLVRGGKSSATVIPSTRQVVTSGAGLLGWTEDLQNGIIARDGSTGLPNSWRLLQDDKTTPSTSLTRVTDSTFGFVGSQPAAVYKSYFYPYQTGFPDVAGGNRCEVLFFYDKNGNGIRFGQGTHVFIGYSIKLQTGIWNNPSSWLQVFQAHTASPMPATAAGSFNFSFDPKSRRLRFQVRGGQIPQSFVTVAYANNGTELPLNKWVHCIVEMQCSTGSDGLTKLWSRVDDQDSNWVFNGQLYHASVQYDGSIIDSAYLKGGGYRDNEPEDLVPRSPESTGWLWSCRFASTFVYADPFEST